MSKSIQVGIRVKPTNSTMRVWDIDSKNNRITLASSGTEYNFNRVFSSDVQTFEIYQEMADDVVEGFLNGYNGTIFAYGSTGSGKTFTMMGNDNHPGITPLAVQHIFEHIQNDPTRKYIVAISYFEIYNETIKDLLHENSERDKRIKFSQQIARSYEDVMITIKGAEENRATGATSMNEHSSRSHAIIRIALESLPVNNPHGVILRSVLNLIDLAGSECQKDTNAEGSRQREASNINRSLLALSNLINALQNGKVTSYRDSKLTLYLQNSLGGNAQTVIICAMNPDHNQQSTSKSTLQFATKAMKIKNQVKANEIKSDKAIIEEQKHEIERLTREIERLKHLLNGHGIQDYNLDVSHSSERFNNINITPHQSKTDKSPSCFDLSDSPNSDNFNSGENNDTFDVTEEIPSLPKKKKRTFTMPPVVTPQKSQRRKLEDDFDLLDFSQTMSPIDSDPTAIILPKKTNKVFHLTEEEKLSDAEAERQAEQLSRAILAHETPLMDSSSSESNERFNQTKILDSPNKEKEQLSKKIAELESLLIEKETCFEQEKMKQAKENEMLLLQIAELEKKASEREQLSLYISELEKQKKERNESDNSFKVILDQQQEEIQHLKEEVIKAQAESMKDELAKNEVIIDQQSKEIIVLKAEIEKTKSALVLKDAQIKGATLNTNQLQGRLQQKDSLMAKYSEDMERQKEELTKQIELLTKENFELKLHNSELSTKNQESAKKQNELSLIQEQVSAKNTEFSKKCDEFFHKLEETNKQCDLLSKKNQELIEEKKALEKKYQDAIINRPISTFQSRFESRIRNLEKDTTELSIGSDSFNCSSIEKKDVKLPSISPIHINTATVNNNAPINIPTRKPLQPKANLNILNDQLSLKQTLLQKIQNANNGNREPTTIFSRQFLPRITKRKLDIESCAFFECVNHMDEVDSIHQDDTFFKKDFHNYGSHIGLIHNRKPFYLSNDITEASLFDSSDSDENIKSSRINDINEDVDSDDESIINHDNILPNSDEKDIIEATTVVEESHSVETIGDQIETNEADEDSIYDESRDSINENDVSLDGDTYDKIESHFEYIDIHRNSSDIHLTHDYISDFLSLFTFLINLFLCIGLFIIE
ncbi:hypothetical protein TRFO_04250 [Tritrichomonas foetus]|uniref:Kinesin motor domain-containing protein n=1 Tax=Tritrichomonas foetus TaxID=1144522 RepID=A0A1J4KKM5_9EUKA|nr:hypothetical protein TRFO_04250 [Tritrichomonas foetus]|eukprot:OHT10246.1 hypothetical protein TRFO_04250 [Tritrichomonas foetus]